MVAILLPQPDEPAHEPGPATGRSVPLRRRATNTYPRPVDLATVEAIPPRSVPRALPDRLTRIRRRRLVALLMAVALFAAAATAGRALVGAAASVEPSSPQPVDAPASSPPGETYVVMPGDTLWSIAAAIAPDSDPRPVVDALRDANGGRPELQVGERLVVRLD
jgi:LysM repeat protein